jgi:hypothetical protein
MTGLVAPWIGQKLPDFTRTTHFDCQMQYHTTVYLANDFAGSSVSDQFSIPLTRLQQGSFDEIDEKMAAAKAWIEAVGQYHKEKLELMGAPAMIQEAADSQAFVVGKLEVFPLCLHAHYTFVFDNSAEQWLISVDGPNSIFLDND